MKKKLPFILLYSRLVVGLLSMALAIIPEKSWMPATVVGIIVYGILSDIFDGILARQFEVSSDKFRRKDTLIDLVFFFGVIFYLLTHNPDPLIENWPLIAVILILEVGMYAVSWLRFKRLPSPHSIPSKFWGIALVISLVVLTLHTGNVFFKWSLIYGCVVHIDRLLIYMLLRNWDHDIPTSWHALQLRKGKEIKRLKIFNG